MAAQHTLQKECESASSGHIVVEGEVKLSKNETIIEHTISCATYFSEVLELLSKHGLRNLWFQFREQLSRFNLWISNVGVFAEFHLSMDYRLRNLSEPRDILVSNLKLIIGDISKGKYPLEERASWKCSHPSVQQILASTDELRFGNGKRGREAENVWISNASREFKSALTTIQDAVTWLHRLSNIVRKASVRRQNERLVSESINNETKQELAAENLRYDLLYAHYLDRDFPAIRLPIDRKEYDSRQRTGNAVSISDCLTDEQQSEYSDIIWLRDRLISSMHVRRMRILYRRRRQDALRIPDVKLPSTKLTVPPTADSNSRGRHNTPSTITRKTSASSTPQNPRAYAPATTLYSKEFQRARNPSRVSEAPTTPLSALGSMSIPPPPLLKPNETEFTCPYCNQIRPRSEVDDKAKWMLVVPFNYTV